MIKEKPKLTAIKFPAELEKDLDAYSKTINEDGFEFNKSAFVISAVREKLEKIKVTKGELKTIKK